MQYESGTRSNHDASRRVYLRAINVCPWSKALWVHGWRVLADTMSPKEKAELMEIATSKGVRLRTDVYEVLLSTLEGTLELGGG